MMFERIIDQVRKFENIIIFPHTNMDGDSVGSAKALALALNKMGKKAVILADEGVPEHVGFLDCDLFKLKNDFIPELAFAVDCSDNKRIENRIDVWNSAKARVCIDHHPGEASFADEIVRDADASACALLIYKFIKELGVGIDKEIAESIYTGILTDTGAFKYSNTDAETHMAAADLYQYGIDHAAICVAVYENKAFEQLKLEAKALENAELFCSGKAVISYLSYDFWNSIGAIYSYTESSVDVIRAIKGTEAAALLKEKEPGIFKVSFRSKSYADVSSIAFKLGGGGHKKAAACTIEMPLSEALALIKKEIEEIL